MEKCFSRLTSVTADIQLFFIMQDIQYRISFVINVMDMLILHISVYPRFHYFLFFRDWMENA